jgi:hypothetical protein
MADEHADPEAGEQADAPAGEQVGAQEQVDAPTEQQAEQQPERLAGLVKAFGVELAAMVRASDSFHSLTTGAADSLERHARSRRDRLQQWKQLELDYRGSGTTDVGWREWREHEVERALAEVEAQEALAWLLRRLGGSG